MTYGVDIFPPFFFKAVFYITGGFSLIWCILWFIFLSDEPRDHKFIGEKEINFIETNRTVNAIDEELEAARKRDLIQVVVTSLVAMTQTEELLLYRKM